MSALVLDIENAHSWQDELEEILRACAQHLSMAYSESEPDYDSISLKEPNPEYNPWK